MSDSKGECEDALPDPDYKVSHLLYSIYTWLHLSAYYCIVAGDFIGGFRSWKIKISRTLFNG